MVDINSLSSDSLEAYTGVAGVIIYVLRMLIVRNPIESTDRREDNVRLGYAEDLRADNAKLRIEIDKLANERNSAMADAGALRSELAIYKGQCHTKSLIMQRCPVIQGESGG